MFDQRSISVQLANVQLAIFQDLKPRFDQLMFNQHPVSVRAGLKGPTRTRSISIPFRSGFFDQDSVFHQS